MTDDSATLRARVDRCPVDGHFCQEGGCCRYDDGVLTFAKSRLLVIERQASEIATLLSSPSWAKEKEELERQLNQCADWLRYYTGNVSSVTADKVREWLASRPVTVKE